MKKLLLMFSTVVFAVFATSCQNEIALDAEPTAVQTVASGEKLQQNTKSAFETLAKFKTDPAANSTREALDYLFPILRKVPFNIDFSTMPEFIGVKTDISKLYGTYTYNGLFVYKVSSDNDSTISLFYNKDLLTTYQFDIYLDDSSFSYELPFEFFNMDVKAEFDDTYVIKIRKDDVLLCDIYFYIPYSNVLHAFDFACLSYIYDENDTTTPDEEKEPVMSVQFDNITLAGVYSKCIFAIIDCEKDASFGCEVTIPNSVPKRASTESVNSWLFNYAKTLTNKIFSGELLSISLEGELMFNIDESEVSFSIDNIKTLREALRKSSYKPEALAQVLNEHITASCTDGDIYFGTSTSSVGLGGFANIHDMSISLLYKLGWSDLEAFVDIQDGDDISLGKYISDLIFEYFVNNDD